MTFPTFPFNEPGRRPTPRPTTFQTSRPTEMGLRLAQAQTADALFDIEAAMTTFDPSLLNYLNGVERARALMMVRCMIRVPLGALIWWTMRRRTPLLALLVTLHAVAPFSVGRYAGMEVRGSGGVVGGHPLIFAYNIRQACLMTGDLPIYDTRRDATGAEGNWWQAEPAFAPTVAELLAQLIATGGEIPVTALRSATALVSMLELDAYGTDLAIKWLREDAVRRGLLTDATLLAGATRSQLVTLHVLGLRCEEGDNGLLFVVLPGGDAGRDHRLAIYPNGKVT
jgi:hypothetical protein